MVEKDIVTENKISQNAKRLLAVSLVVGAAALGGLSADAMYSTDRITPPSQYDDGSLVYDSDVQDAARGVNIAVGSIYGGGIATAGLVAMGGWRRRRNTQ